MEEVRFDRLEKLSKLDIALLSLVRAGLWEAKAELSNMSLSSDEWMELFRSAQRQTVLGLLYRGLENVEDETFEPSEEVMMKLALEMDKCEGKNARMNALVETLFSEFEAEGLHPIQLKGQESARLYEYPELRESGDIDIFFSAEEFEKATPENAQAASDGSVEYMRDGVVVEHHRQLLDITRNSKQKFIDKLIDRYGFQKRSCSNELTILLLSTHVLKHCLGRGVGLRQICDYARARKVLVVDNQNLDLDSEQLGLTKWNRVLDSFCVKYLGMDGEVTENKLADKLLEIVFEGGNFGMHNGKKISVWNTAASFVSNLGFSLRVAPAETFSTFVSLVKGRLNAGKMV